MRKQWLRVELLNGENHTRKNHKESSDNSLNSKLSVIVVRTRRGILGNETCRPCDVIGCWESLDQEQGSLYCHSQSKNLQEEEETGSLFVFRGLWMMIT